MKYENVLNLPIPDSGCGAVRITYERLDLVAEYEYHLNGQDLIGRLRLMSTTWPATARAVGEGVLAGLSRVE